MASGAADLDAAPRDEHELEERLSRPTPDVVRALRDCPGDVLVLGAGGKMGPSLVSMARRAADIIADGRRVFAVSRWRTAAGATSAASLESIGVRVLHADLEDRRALALLPDAPNVIYMAGQKFGTSGEPWRTWMMNVVLPARVAERFAGARFVAFSTGNVYPLVPASSPGASEAHPLTPAGEYANSCVGRERVIESVSRERGLRVALIRLFYAVDLRYGVLVDVAARVFAGQPVDVRMGWVNVVWQGDANAQAIRALVHASAPPITINVTGPERLGVRDLAGRFGALFGRAPIITGTEAADALLADTALSQSLFGPPIVGAGTLIQWVAAWIAHGGRRLSKPTGFEVRDGRF